MINNDQALNNVHDLQGLQKLKQSAAKNDPKALQAVAKQFESLFLNMLLQNMRKANDAFAEGSYFDSNDSKFYRDMYDQQMSQSLANGNGIGLAEMMVKQLSPTAPRTETNPLEMPLSRLAAQPQGPAFEQALAQTARAAIDAMGRIRADGQALGQVEPGEFSATPATLTAAADGGALAATLHARAVSPAGTTSAPRADAAPEPVAENGRADDTNRTVTALPERFESPQAFVRTLLPLAEKIAAAAGIDPKVIVAQAALETGWGQHMIRRADGRSANNLFGIKADSRWQGEQAVVGTLEYRQGIPRREQAAFRAYPDVDASLRDYVDFLRSNPRYQSALAQGQDGQAYARALQAAGYATDPAYASKISGIMTGDLLKNISENIKAG